MSTSAPVLLSLDTATERIHAALSVGEQVRARELPGGAQASSTLLPALGALLSEAGLVWADLDAIAFGSGPGAFTGLRTACAITQGLALGLERPVIPLDTLMAVAEDARQQSPEAWLPGDLLWVLQDARMGELYVGAFRWDGRSWLAEATPQLWPLDEPARRWAISAPEAPEGAPRVAPGLRLAGNALLAYPAELAPLLAPEAGVGRWPRAQPRGAALAALAQQAWAQGLAVDAALALPRYVRDKVAQTTAERAAAKAAAA
ncbi:tRNA (adenosine(37)-N6)-threonylcarbamoyltransferase complex dimerization subunit type 1 TsaB [Aquabacterium sp.]|uniref:tRNA (adenosine(37)-N6)-threonylcarbamoyltransferase complex dimerization subunit type 1 TsaB n=1 Tax=Aquabacterium sp. TaxID=1872578 RepID=UPI0025B84DBA|nr:tRNA (adenosine(37)-N6)-threonylcarbamoyltransferase complex dimerization subunit type 1 TsaB [Aquabacterium sp.]